MDSRSENRAASGAQLQSSVTQSMNLRAKSSDELDKEVCNLWLQ